MDPITTAAASGMRARAESLTVLANNLANQASAGFKADREAYSSYLSPDASAASTDNLLVSPVIEQHWTDFTQGTLRETGRESDFALRGSGYFMVQAPEGKLLTRNGEFHLAQDGTLQSQAGFPVLDHEGQPLKLDPGRGFEVSAGGEIRQQGSLVGRLGVVDVENGAALTKRHGLYFRFSRPESELRRAEGTEVLQKRVESSNSPPAESAVKLITVLRQFEVLQRAIQIGAEMGRRADEIARVGN
jgi:flagellar basal body rod protein FlgG